MMSDGEAAGLEQRGHEHPHMQFIIDYQNLFCHFSSLREVS
jgi:hypothetical protein